jgi:hypothetical protein
MSAFPTCVTVGCDQDPITHPLGNAVKTESINASMLASAAWLSAALTIAVRSNLRFTRLLAPPITCGVMYGDPGTSTKAGGVMFSAGYAKTTRPAAARDAAIALRVVTKLAKVAPSI